ncbi:MAG: helix-turn-helix domain-containing protein [Bacteroidota bacterium]
MNLRFHTPAYPLRTFIKSMMCYEGYSGSSRYEMLLPDGQPQLIIPLDDQSRVTVPEAKKGESGSRLPESWITGLFSKPLLYESEQRATTLSVQFETYGLAQLLGVPASELTNQLVESRLLLQDSILYLREQLMQAGSFQERFARVEQFFLPRLPGAKTGLAEAIVHSRDFDHTPLREISQHYGYSQKHIAHEFRRCIGLTPKKLQTLRSINQAIRLWSETPSLSSAQVALTCGFYDQSHFIKQFRAHTSLTPDQYRKHAKAYPHVVSLP